MLRAQSREDVPSFAMQSDRMQAGPKMTGRAGKACELINLAVPEVDDKLKQWSRLDEVEQLTVVAYGNSQQLTMVVGAIDGAGSGSAAAGNVLAGKNGSLAGERKTLLRPESAERQTARAYLPQLAAAIEDYGRTVDFEKHQIDISHRQEQHRLRQEIREPSPELSAILRIPGEGAGMRLRETPHLRAELERFTASVHRRLAVEDRRALKDGDLAGLANGLSIPQDRAAALMYVHKRAASAARGLNVQRQQLERSAGLGLNRER